MKSGLAGRPIGDERPRLIDPSVDVRDRDAVLLEQPLAQHLVFERKGAAEIEPVTADVQLEQLAVAFDVEEPDRSPPWLARRPDDLAADVGLDPPGNRLEFAVVLHRPVLPRQWQVDRSAGVATLDGA